MVIRRWAVNLEIISSKLEMVVYLLLSSFTWHMFDESLYYMWGDDNKETAEPFDKNNHNNKKKKLINRSVGLKTERKGRGLWLRYTDMHAGEKERKEGSVRRRGSHDSLGYSKAKNILLVLSHPDIHSVLKIFFFSVFCECLAVWQINKALDSKCVFVDPTLSLSFKNIFSCIIMHQVIKLIWCIMPNFLQSRLPHTVSWTLLFKCVLPLWIDIRLMAVISTESALDLQMWNVNQLCPLNSMYAFSESEK